MAMTKASRLFLERSGIRSTYRNPTPTVDCTVWGQHRIALQSPLPPVELIPADQGETVEPWPHGESCETA